MKYLYGQYVPFVVVVEGINTFVVVAMGLGTKVVVAVNDLSVVVIFDGIVVVVEVVVYAGISITDKQPNSIVPLLTCFDSKQ